jgi:hypothetical protein
MIKQIKVYASSAPDKGGKPPYGYRSITKVYEDDSEWIVAYVDDTIEFGPIDDFAQGIAAQFDLKEVTYIDRPY